VVIDFTTPEAVVQNMRACLATGAKMCGDDWLVRVARDMRGWRSASMRRFIWHKLFDWRAVC